MVSIERVVDYTKLPQEPPFRSPNDKHLPDSWPAVGALEFRDVNFAYDRCGPRVLHDVSFRVLPREKVGIVGRTGAGKSSLIYCLFRLSEVDTGAILIDAQSTGPPMGLHTLRKQISIIPQDPVLFTGEDPKPFSFPMPVALHTCLCREGIRVIKIDKSFLQRAVQ